MNVGALTALFFGSLLVFLFSGLPVAFALIGVSVIFSLAFWSVAGLNVVAFAAHDIATTEVLLAAPMFIFMANILVFSGIGEMIFETLYQWFGAVRGGLTAVVVTACTIMAAMTGIGGTGVLTVGRLAIPEMNKRGYKGEVSYGCLPPASALGSLIPPSVLLLIIAQYGNVSVGKLFMGGLITGVLISVVMISYIFIRCALKPDLAPALPPEKRPGWGKRVTSLKNMIAPVAIIVAVLGSIYSGAATPTEAAGVGVVAVLIVTMINRRLTLQNLKSALYASLRTSCMVYFLVIGGTVFASVVGALGTGSWLKETLSDLGTSSFLFLAIAMVIMLILGMFMDGTSATVISIPVLMPIVVSMGIDPLWFSVLAGMNLVIGYSTPPFAMNIFYLVGVMRAIGQEPPMKDIYRAVLPYIVLQIAVLALVIIFPQIAVWLPNRMK